jgi:hypothetical protein
MYLTDADRNIILASVKSSVTAMSSFYAGMIPEADYEAIATNVVADVNAAHPAAPATASSSET